MKGKVRHHRVSLLKVTRGGRIVPAGFLSIPIRSVNKSRRRRKKGSAR